MPSTVVLVDIPPCVEPKLTSPTLCIPSTYTSSPTANGCSSNPLIGVSKKHVTTPELLICNELMATDGLSTLQSLKELGLSASKIDDPEAVGISKLATELLERVVPLIWSS